MSKIDITIEVADKIAGKTTNHQTFHLSHHLTGHQTSHATTNCGNNGEKTGFYRESEEKLAETLLLLLAIMKLKSQREPPASSTQPASSVMSPSIFSAKNSEKTSAKKTLTAEQLWKEASHVPHP